MQPAPFETVTDPLGEALAQACMKAAARLMHDQPKYAPLRQDLDRVVEHLKAELATQLDGILADAQQVIDACMGGAMLEATVSASCVLVAIAALDRALAG